MHVTRPALLAATAALLLSFPLSAQAKDKPILRIGDLTTFTGTGIADVTFGSTTAETIKTEYKTDRHSALQLPWSFQLSAVEKSPYTLYPLFSGKDDKTAVLSGLLAWYPYGIANADFTGQFSDKETDYYQKDRQSDWKIETWPTRGIVAFEDNDSVTAILLISPGSLLHGIGGLVPEITPLCTPTDVHASDPKVADIGSISVDTSSLSGATIDDSGKTDFTQMMQQATAGGTIRMTNGGEGTYTTAISGQYDKSKGGTIYVTCIVQGRSPYGTWIVGTANQSVYYASGGDTLPCDQGLEATVQATMATAEGQFQTNMFAAGPPSPDCVMRLAWNDVFNTVRQQSLGAVITDEYIKPSPSQPWVAP